MAYFLQHFGQFLYKSWVYLFHILIEIGHIWGLQLK
jgi:hypothetical protein